MNSLSKNFPISLFGMEDVVAEYYNRSSATGTDSTSTVNATVPTPLGSGTVDWVVKASTLCGLNIWLDDDGAVTHDMGPQIGIVLKSSGAISNSISFYISNINSTLNSYKAVITPSIHGLCADEWRTIWLPRSLFSQEGTAPDWCTTTENTNLPVYRINMALTGGASDVTLSIGGIIHHNPDKAKVILNFDDARDLQVSGQGVYNWVYPRMKLYNWKFNIPVISSVVGTEGYMTLDQLKELEAYGCEVINHTTIHTPGLDTATEEEWIPQFGEFKKWAVANGFTKGIDFIAYPGTEAVLDTANGGDLIEALGVMGRGRCARECYGGAQSSTLQYNNYSTLIPNDMMGIAHYDPTTISRSNYGISGLKTQLAINSLHKGVLVLYFHNIRPVGDISIIDNSVGFMEEFIADLRARELAGEVEISTFGDWYNEIYGVGEKKRSLTLHKATKGQ